MPKRMTTDEFRIKAIAVHGDRYDYSEVELVDVYTKISIICKIHGSFCQIPYNHLRGAGCKKCNDERNAKSRSYSKEVFEGKAREVHGDKYDYSESKYVNSQTKIKIICNGCNNSFLQNPNCHLRGAGCRICYFDRMAKSRTFSIDDFMERAISVHGNRYDYSKSIYITALTKIEIICKEHCSFWQVPASHLDGHGCHKCKVDNQTLNTNDFLKMAHEVHGNIYCYNKAIYKCNKEDVIITCSVHGDFNQSPRSHLVGKGCQQCAIDAQKVGRTDFIDRSDKIHGNKYNYDDVIYETNKIPVVIYCPEHGQFNQAPTDHMKGAGCPKCSQLRQKEKVTFTTEKFKELASIKHNNFFNYDKVDYIHSHIKITITCPEHGDFEQSPSNHLSGRGCPKCRSSTSKESIDWLNYLGIPDDPKHREVKLKIGKRRFKADGFDPDTNTVYEFYGDYFHGNPKVFDANDDSGLGGRTYGELYDATIEREQIIKNSGYRIVSIWENDWRRK